MADNLNTFSYEEEKTVDASKKFRYGIIGTGWIADYQMRALLRQPDVEIVAVADLVPGKAEEFLKKYDIPNEVKVYPNHHAMLEAEQLDGVSVCTYNAPTPSAPLTRLSTASASCLRSR